MELVNGFYNMNKKSIADPYGNGIQRFEKLARCVNLAVKGLGDNTQSAIDVAKALYTIKQEELYKDYPIPGADKGYVFADFNSFCEKFFNAKKSTIANYLALYERFGADSPLRVKGIPPKFENEYSYTQLLLMLPLSASELLTIKPNMSCGEIKAYVKEQKEKNIVNSNQLENSQVDTSEVVEPEEERYQSYKLDTAENCKAFLKTYQRWDKIADFNVYTSAVDFRQIILRNFTVIAYASSHAGIWDEFFYIVNHTLNHFEGTKQYFSVCDRLNIEGASALLSTLPVEYACLRI